MCLGLQRAVIKSNIEGGFHATRIWPFNFNAIEKYLGPSKQFIPRNTTASNGDNKQHTLEQDKVEIADSWKKDNGERKTLY